MEYTIKQLADLAGVTPRTLRHYGEIGLLQPAKRTDAGYRIYTAKEVNRLQQILFLREMDIPLGKIKAVLDTDEPEYRALLLAHREALFCEQARLARMIDTIEKTVAHLEGAYAMTDKEKFEGLKRKEVEDNEICYGNHIRAKYGEDRIARANERYMSMPKEQYSHAKTLEEEIMVLLKEVLEKGDVRSPLATELCRKHQEWLLIYWEDYSKEAHLRLCEMYVEDTRFTAYYERAGAGGASMLLEAMKVYLGRE